MINITLPDNTVRKYEKGVTAIEIAMSISEGLARNVLSAEVNGEVIDATRPIEEDSSVKLLTWRDEKGQATMWHSSAHLKAETIEHFNPGSKFGIGPDIENGFYYDIDLGDKVISENDFKKNEARLFERLQALGLLESQSDGYAYVINHYGRKSF